MIRIYLMHDKLPVRLVGVGADNSYDVEGITHWSEGDVEVMEAIGSIPIWTLDRETPKYTQMAAHSTYVSDEPSYVRLGR